LAASVPTQRRTDLDWLRVLLFSGLIVYHLGLMYAAWSPFAVKSAHRHGWVEIALLVTHPWRMCLLFMISGVATRYAVEKLGTARLFVTRSIQLLPPLLFGVALVVPIQGYLGLVDNFGYQKSYWTFLAELFTGGHRVMFEGRRFIVPVYAHLWFVAYLWTYVVALVVALRFAPRWLQAAQAWLEKLVSGPGLLLWPLVVLIGFRFTLFPIFSVTLELTDDWYNHAVSLSMFLFGFLIARSEKVWAQFVALRWVGLALAVVAFAAYGVLAWGQGTPEYVEQSNPVMHLLYPLVRWGGIIAVLGFAQRALTWNCKALAYLNGGIFTYYIVHQPALLFLMHKIKPLALDPRVEFLAVLAGSSVICAFAYEVARAMGGFGVVLGAPRGRAAPRWAQAIRNAVLRLGGRPAPLESPAGS
jgi:hypothetical protein